MNALTVDVRVTDANGAFIRDLARDEFRIYEDDVEQDITTFALVDLPFDPVPPPALAGVPISRDVVTNRDAPSGRFYFLVLDDIGSDVFSTDTIRALARQFIEEHLDPADMVAIVNTSGRDETIRQFTRDRSHLLEAVRRFQAGFASTVIPSPVGNPSAAMMAPSASSTIDYLSELVAHVGSFNARRKAVVLFTSSQADWLSDQELAAQVEIIAAKRRLINAAARGNVNIYTIDPVGNPSAPPVGRIKPAPPAGRMSGVESVAELSGQYSTVLDLPRERDIPFPNRRLDIVDRWQSNRWQAAQNLDLITDGTGGFTFSNSNDFTAAFDRLVEANSTYYLLSYTSNRPQLDNKLRRIRVEVSRPGLTVRARNGYVASDDSVVPSAPRPPGMSAALNTMMRSPIPVPGLTLQIAGPLFRGAGKEANADVVVEARGADLLFTPDGTRYTGAMHLVVIAAEDSGRVVKGERGELRMKLAEQTHDRVIANGVRLLSRLPLKAGRYQLRVGATDEGGGQKFGSVQYDLVVPDFSKGPVSLSSVVLKAATPDPLITRGTTEPWNNRLDGLPTLRRQFSTVDQIEGFTEIYDNKPGGRHQIACRVAVHSTNGNPVFELDQTFAATPTKEKWQTHRVNFAVPAGALPAGDYVLSVTAIRDRDGGRAVRERTLFSVR